MREKKTVDKRVKNTTNAVLHSVECEILRNAHFCRTFFHFFLFALLDMAHFDSNDLRQSFAT